MGAEEDALNGMSLDSENRAVEVNKATEGLDSVQEQVAEPCSSEKEKVGDALEQETLKADSQDSSTPCEQYEAAQDGHEQAEQDAIVVDKQPLEGTQREENRRKGRPCEVSMFDEQTVETQQEYGKTGEQNSSMFEQGGGQMETEVETHAVGNAQAEEEQHTEEVEKMVGIAVLRKLENNIDKTGGTEIPNSKQDDSVERVEVLLARGLSSSDSGTCMKAMSELERWLSLYIQVDEAQLVTIWKAIFYQVWRTCNSTLVTELCTSIGRVLEALNPELALLVFKVLLSSLGEEWSRIDKKRIMRFGQLLHICVRQMFKMLKSEDWKEDLTSKFIGAVGAQTETLSHALMQPFFQELKVFVPSSTDTLKTLLEPFIAVYADNHSSVLQKVKDFVFTPLLQEARAAARSNLADEKTSLGAMVLCLSISVRFLEMSSSDGLSKINRKLVDQLHEDFKKSEKRRSSLQALKKLVSSGEEASNDVDSASEMHKELSVSGTKRKRVNAGEASYALRSMKKRGQQDPEAGSEDETRNEPSDVSTPEEDLTSEDQRPAKRVRFSLKDNVVWSPAKPLPPPAWVTVPPRAVPRGSALKAGVLPGPIAPAPPPRPPKKTRRPQNNEGTSKSKKKRLAKRKGKASKRQRTS